MAPPNRAQLVSNDIADLKYAHPEAIQLSLANLHPNLAANRWLGEDNRYRTDPITNVRNDFEAEGINHKHLAEYVAASVPLHAVDGWAYLGRAIHAHLIGDVWVARHLAYYAELRAAMSLLASQGIGVFNSHHVVVKSVDEIVIIRSQSTTHSFVWNALEWWASQGNSPELLGNLIKPNGVRLDVLLNNVPGYAQWQPVATDMIQSFGLDLHNEAMENDRNSRNNASYRPTEFNTTIARDSKANANFAIELWSSFEPVAYRFDRFDNHLLRNALKLAFDSVNMEVPDDGGEVVPENDGIRYEAVVKAVLREANLDEPKSVSFGQFLRRESDPDNLMLLTYAQKITDLADADYHLGMMSRATILLVLASSSTRSLMQDANISMIETKFWWGQLGVDRGIWSSAPDPIDLENSWADVEEEIIELQDWIDGDEVSCASLVGECPRPLTRLSQLELVGLWGMFT